MGDIIINPKQFNHYMIKEKVSLKSKLYPTGFEHQYDLIVGFVKKWILSVVGENYFKNIYVNESIAYKRLKRKSQTDLLKYDNPQIAIIPRIDFNYNRDNIDLYQKGLNTLQLNRIDESIIKDFENNSFIGLKTRQIKIDFDIKIKLSTKIQQLKLYELLKIGLKAGSTQDIYEESTFQIPFELINDMYYGLFDKKIESNNLEDTKKIVDYINSHSIAPVKYDLDLSNGTYQFYIDVEEFNHHISFLDEISIDDGEREGQSYTNFMIDFSFSIYSPCPMFYYWFYSDKSKINNYVYSYDSTKIKDNNETLEFSDIIKPITIPNKLNNHELYISTQITDVKKGDFIMSISEVKNGLGFADQIQKSIEYCISRKINPCVFISFLALYQGIKKEIEVDWYGDKLIIKDIPRDCTLDFVIYVDKLYINKIISDIKLNRSQ